MCPVKGRQAMCEVLPGEIRLCQSTQSDNAFSNLRGEQRQSLLNHSREQASFHPLHGRHEHCIELRRLGHTLERGRNTACSSWHEGTPRTLLECQSVRY